MTVDLLSLDRIRARVEAAAAAVAAQAHLLPTYGRTEDFARPHIEVDSAYHFVVVERGEELERRSTRELDELLYWIFASVTFGMACAFEVKNRQHGVDFRRLMFTKQLELLGTLDTRWQERRKIEITATLAQHPFVDTP